MLRLPCIDSKPKLRPRVRSRSGLCGRVAGPALAIVLDYGALPDACLRQCEPRGSYPVEAGPIDCDSVTGARAPRARPRNKHRAGAITFEPARGPSSVRRIHPSGNNNHGGERLFDCRELVLVVNSLVLRGPPANGVKESSGKSEIPTCLAPTLRPRDILRAARAARASSHLSPGRRGTPESLPRIDRFAGPP